MLKYVHHQVIFYEGSLPASQKLGLFLVLEIAAQLVGQLRVASQVGSYLLAPVLHHFAFTKYILLL